jgi:hypothetical protein
VVATTSMPTLVHRNRRRPGSACPSNSKDDEDGTDGGDFDEGNHPTAQTMRTTPTATSTRAARAHCPTAQTMRMAPTTTSTRIPTRATAIRLSLGDFDDVSVSCSCSGACAYAPFGSVGVQGRGSGITIRREN